MARRTDRKLRSIRDLEQRQDAGGLVPYLEDRDPWVRRVAARSLGKLGDPRAMQHLIDAVQHDDSLSRSDYAEALANLADERARDFLLETIRDPEPHTRGWAAVGLGMLGDGRAVEPLIEALKSHHSVGYVRIRVRAAELLAELGDPRAVEPLFRAAVDYDANDPDYEVPRAVVRALQSFIPEVIATLEARDRGPSQYQLRAAAARVLGRSGDARAVQPLVGALKYPSKSERRAAAEALGELAGSLGKLKVWPAVDALNEALKDADSEVHRAAQAALDAIGASARPGRLP